MPWSALRLIHKDDGVFAEGIYSQDAAAVLRTVGFTETSEGALHLPASMKREERAQRLAAAVALLKVLRLRDFGRAGLEVHQVVSAARKARTVQDIALLAETLWEHADNPARTVEEFAAAVADRAAALVPEQADRIGEAAERCSQQVYDAVAELCALAEALPGPPPAPKHTAPTPVPIPPATPARPSGPAR
ncbi:hypothetical protein [Streptomyces sp. YIM 98790]|uniref:hypothetical protein n=1 Tax=Streptomyces sp. YIM 98790 TaxID=2689077 RepID=UPI00140806F1|nr:hypothetical protein [Streptomyces sp. YIM 98790]